MHILKPNAVLSIAALGSKVVFAGIARFTVSTNAQRSTSTAFTVGVR